MYSYLFLDTIRRNAKIKLQELTSKLKISKFEFYYALDKILVLTPIDRRYANPYGIQIDLMQRIQQVLDRCVVTSTPAKTGRYYSCLEDLIGKNLYKERRDKLNTRVKAV